MSEEMAVGDSSGEEIKVESEPAADASVAEPERASSEVQEPPAPPKTEEATAASTDSQDESAATEQNQVKVEDTKRADKRRASTAFSETSEEFHGFDEVLPQEEPFKGFETADQKDLSDYNRILDRLEAEVTEARKSYTPLRTVVANMAIRAGKRARKDTDGSRPSSGLSSRSDGDGPLSNEGAGAASSPANKRRATIEISSPLLRVPLERGWKRELVYRAALDAHSRRNADIYYYTPQGKKLRSTREVAEHLAGTGLTIENFSFFKEPLGVDDPEKEIIRDAKLMRRVDSPVSSPAPVVIEGKRTPKPKPPKGASPVHDTPKSPPAKIKVKSVGSRLSGSGPAPAQNAKQQKKPLQTATNENNNTAAWKKPRQPPAGPHQGPPGPQQSPHPGPPGCQSGAHHAPPYAQPGPHGYQRGPSPAGPPVKEPTPPPPPPLQSRPQHPPIEETPMRNASQQPCSLTCGRGVPTLACDACLCLYHPACVNVSFPAGAFVRPFLCKNCDESAPPTDPPPLVHKSGVTPTTSHVIPQPRLVPAQPAKARADQRVTLRMKVSGGGPDGERVWAVAKPPPIPTPTPIPTSSPAPTPTTTPIPVPVPVPVKPLPRGQASFPQSIAVLNGRRFIVVPRNLIQNAQPQ